MNEAALLAARRDKTAVDRSDFEEAIDRIIAGLEKKRAMSVRERRIVAFHESGHAIVATVLPNLDPVHKISIVQRGFGALGYTMQLPLEDRYLMSKSDLENQLAVLLGGRTAEALVFGEVSTGAQNDLMRATDIARAMVTEYGMSETIGPVQPRRPAPQPVPGIAVRARARRLCRGHRAGHRLGGQTPDRVRRIRGAADPDREARHPRHAVRPAARQGSD